MAYIKDPKTGRYIKTAEPATKTFPAPAGDVPVVGKLPEIQEPATPAGQMIRFERGPGGKYVKKTVAAPAEAEPSALTKSGKPNLQTVPGLMLAAEQAGVELPKEATETAKRSTLQKVLDVLNTGGYAVGGLISGKGIKAGIKEKILPSEALNIKNPVLGFAADVLLDPTTYITFGYGGGAKLAAKGGSVILNKAGTKLLKKTIAEVGEEAARKALAKKIAQEGGEKLLAKGGIKFAGKEIISRQAVNKVASAADTAIEHLPAVGKIYKTAKEVGAKAFVPFSDIKKLPGGEKYAEKFSAFTKGTRAKVAGAIDEYTALGKQAKEALGPGAGTRVAELLETAGYKPAKPILKGLKDYEKEFIRSQGVNLDNLAVKTTAKESPRKILKMLEEGAKKEVKSKTGRVAAAASKSKIILLETDAGMKVLDGAHRLAGALKKGAKSIDYHVVREVAPKAERSQVADLIGTLQKGQKEIAKAEKTRGILKSELKDTGYLRHFLTPEAREFLDKGGKVSGELTKPLRVRAGFAKERKISGTLAEINKKFRQAHGIDLFEPDAFKALAGRKAESIKAVATHDFLKEVGKEFGITAKTKSFKSPVTGKTIRGAQPVIKDGIRYVESSVPQLKGTLLPEPIVKHLDETRRILSNDEATNAFLRLYDRTLAVWKGSVTGWFPAFHGRNFVGGVFNNWLGGVKNPARYIQGDQIARGAAGKVTTKVGTTYTYDQVRQIAKELGVTGQPGYLDVFKEVEKEMGKGTLAKLGQTPQAAMEAVENRLRMPLFVDRLIKGDEPKEAAQAVFKFHFDYAPEGITQFEKNVMKRLIPFYRWTRGNVPLQLEQIVKQPGKYAAIGKGAEKLGVSEDDPNRKYLPPYIQEAFSFPAGKDEKTGEAKYRYGINVLPAEDINRFTLPGGGVSVGEAARRNIEKLIGEASPLIKYPIELATGKDLFRGQDIEKSTYVAKWLPEVPALAKFLDVKAVPKKDGTYSYIGDPYKLHFINTFLGRIYSTAGANTDEKNTLAEKALYNLLGIKTKSFDVEKEKSYRERELKTRIEDLLEQQGVIRKFETPYIPNAGASKKKTQYIPQVTR